MQLMFTKTCAVAVALIIVSFLHSITDAQEPSSDIEAKLSAICRKHDLPAMSAAVVNAQELVGSACYGVRKRGTSDTVALSDRFPIGSNTKSMTAVLAAVLVEAGKIEWTTTIGDVWPKATDKDIHPKLRQVTLDQLLSHQGGLEPNISDLSDEAWARHFQEKQTPTLERKGMLKYALAKAPANPIGKFAYSNLGYAIASAMLESRAGDSYESLMKKHLFEPLQMGSAEFRALQSVRQWKEPLLWWHRTADGAPVDPRAMGSENPTVYAAAGTINLTIEDYAKYALWQLRGKPGPVLKSQDTFDHLRKPQVDYSLPGAKYGCGWICVNTGLGPALNHAGSNTNAFAVIWIIPEANFAAVVCTNSGQAQAFPACDEMVTELIGTYATKRPSMSNRTSEPGSKKVEAKNLVGRYQLAPNFIFDVSLKDDHLMVGITNQATQEVFAESPTMWAYKSVAAKLEFHIGKDGQAEALTLHQNGIKQKAKRLKD